LVARRKHNHYLDSVVEDEREQLVEAWLCRTKMKNKFEDSGTRSEEIHTGTMRKSQMKKKGNELQCYGLEKTKRK